MPQPCQNVSGVEIHSRDDNLQYSAENAYIYRHIRLCQKQGSTPSTIMKLHRTIMLYNQVWADKSDK